MSPSKSAFTTSHRPRDSLSARHHRLLLKLISRSTAASTSRRFRRPRWSRSKRSRSNDYVQPLYKPQNIVRHSERMGTKPWAPPLQSSSRRLVRRAARAQPLCKPQNSVRHSERKGTKPWPPPLQSSSRRMARRARRAARDKKREAECNTVLQASLCEGTPRLAPFEWPAKGRISIPSLFEAGLDVYLRL